MASFSPPGGITVFRKTWQACCEQSSDPVYGHVFGRSANVTTVANVTSIVTENGTVKNVKFIWLDKGGGYNTGAKGLDITLYVNGVASALIAQPRGDTALNTAITPPFATVSTLAVAAGDRVVWQSAKVGDTSNPGWGISCDLEV